MNTPDTKATSRVTALRHLHGSGRHVRSNIVAYLALAVAVGSGGSYALAATTSNGTIAVCVDKGSGVMHLAKHPRCGRHQSRIGLSSALDRPAVSAWAAVMVSGYVASAHGRVDDSRRALACTRSPSPPRAVEMRPITRRWSASTTVEPPAGLGGNPCAFPVAWTETASTGIEAFTIHTGVVVSGAVPATKRVVQLHRLVRMRAGGSRRCATEFETSSNPSNALDARFLVRLCGGPHGACRGAAADRS